MSGPAPRLVAIVGRPNVGKSALFNRLARRRLAIVHEQAGVTRDRVTCEVEHAGRRFDLMDTGGIGLADGARSPDAIEQAMVGQAEVAIEDAAAIIMVVDATAGVVPLDAMVARRLHEAGRPVVVAANKADTADRDGLSAEFEALGFPVVPVSALHNRGIAPLLEGILPALSETADAAGPPRRLKVAVVGRPNAGKSSYINRLLRAERVIVSEVPGTTRDSVHVPFTIGSGPEARAYELIDTAGVRGPSRVQTAVDKFSLMRTKVSIEACDVAVVMFDAQEGPRLTDKKLGRQVADLGKGCVIMVNKWDLAEGHTTQRQYGEALARALPYLAFAPVVYVSAKTGYNVRRSIEAIDLAGAGISTQLTTGVLNRVLRDAWGATAPPSFAGKPLKLYYATQAGMRPVRIRLFVNEPKAASASFQAYLTRKLREAFGLEGAPVLLDFRPRSRTDGRR